jgi:hypothetical protein
VPPQRHRRTGEIWRRHICYTASRQGSGVLNAERIQAIIYETDTTCEQRQCALLIVEDQPN